MRDRDGEHLLPANWFRPLCSHLPEAEDWLGRLVKNAGALPDRGFRLIHGRILTEELPN